MAKPQDGVRWGGPGPSQSRSSSPEAIVSPHHCAPSLGWPHPSHCPAALSLGAAAPTPIPLMPSAWGQPHPSHCPDALGLGAAAPTPIPLMPSAWWQLHPSHCPDALSLGWPHPSHCPDALGLVAVAPTLLSLALTQTWLWVYSLLKVCVRRRRHYRQTDGQWSELACTTLTAHRPGCWLQMEVMRAWPQGVQGNEAPAHGEAVESRT